MQRILESLARLPRNTPAFQTRSAQITIGQIRATAESVADMLTRRPEPVLLHTSSASLFAASLLACARVGRTVSCPAHTQQGYLAELGANGAILLSDDDQMGALPHLRLALQVDGAREWPVAPSALSLQFYTSGSTGQPKRVYKQIEQLDREALALNELWGEAVGETYGTVSHQHIYGMLFRIVWPIASGRLSSDAQAIYWEELPSDLGSRDSLITSPAHLSRIPPSAAHLRPGLVFSSGAPLSFEAAESCGRILGYVPVEVLGSTETGGIAWRRQSSRDAVWQVLPGVVARADADGLLTIVSPFTGTSEQISTNDRVEFVSGGFRLLGRADRVAKVEGTRVSLARVEEALKELRLIADAAVIDLPRWNGALGAVVQLSEDGAARFEELGAFRLSREIRRRLSGRLAPLERPKHWKFGSIPADTQGKRSQRMLREHFEVPDQSRLGKGRVVVGDAGRAEIDLELPADLVWFEGHFPGEPVLAGLAQVHIALGWAEHLWKWRPADSNITQLKFRKILRPDTTVRLELSRLKNAECLKFAYRLHDGVVASEGQIGG
jgi:3-hydroxymyristoyl/3-hydroxydecanoyl-(acyl carrier protein) dehydratase